MRLAIIPARGGSKRIPRKNIKLFDGLPMIAWSIQAARESKCFDQIVVSTDDPEIAEVARGYGAMVPFTRPLDLSDDYTGTIPVIAHAIRWYQNLGKEISEVCCIYATAPFVCPEDIKSGLAVLQSSDLDYVFSATSFPFPIQRAFRLANDQSVEMFNPELFDTRSQDLEEAWHDAGQFYWGKSESWLLGTKVFSRRSKAILLPRHKVQDIDTQEDWDRAEVMRSVLKRRESDT